MNGEGAEDVKAGSQETPHFPDLCSFVSKSFILPRDGAKKKSKAKESWELVNHQIVKAGPEAFAQLLDGNLPSSSRFALNWCYQTWRWGDGMCFLSSDKHWGKQTRLSTYDPSEKMRPPFVLQIATLLVEMYFVESVPITWAFSEPASGVSCYFLEWTRKRLRGTRGDRQLCKETAVNPELNLTPWEH